MNKITSGKYVVPESILRHKLKGKMVKALGGRYYVYDMKHVKVDGKWKIKMGELIGTITESAGFIANTQKLASANVDTLEYGQYALVMKASGEVFRNLVSVFGKDGINIYSAAVIHATNGYVSTKNVKEYYDQSVVSLAFPTAAISEGTLSKTYALLGKCEGLRIRYFETLMEETDGKDLAIDGKAIATSSLESDLSDYGYKSQILKSEMMNLLTLFCIEEKRPLATLLIRGDSPDKVSVMNFLKVLEVKKRLVIMDGGFFSERLFQLLEENQCHFIVPAGDNTVMHKEAPKPHKGANKSFLYRKGKNGGNVTVEYREFREEKMGRRFVYFKDRSENLALSTKYLEALQAGKEGVSEEGYKKIQRDGGTIVLYTDCDKSPEELFTAYKSRWTIETYYDLLDNRFDMNDLKQEDYYVLQGLSFVIGVAMDIVSLVNATCQKAGISRPDALLEGRRIKIGKSRGEWELKNMGLKKTADLFASFSLSLLEPEKWDFTAGHVT